MRLFRGLNRQSLQKRGVLLFGGIFLTTMLLGGLEGVQGCADVCIYETCSDGTMHASCCGTSSPSGLAPCPCVPGPLPGCPVPPPCDINMGDTCRGSANACGMTSLGTTLCDGSCGAVPPSDSLCPVCDPWTGSSCISDPNSCGMVNWGVIRCDGSCDIGAPSDALCSATHTITATAGSGGSIAPAGSVSVAQGTNRQFTITPDPGYTIDSVVVDGSNVGSVGTYWFNNISSDHTIGASFLSSGLCNNGVLNPGEQCDLGALNGACPASCSLTCTNNSCAPGIPAALNICPSSATVSVGDTQAFTAWYTPTGTSFINCSNTTGAVNRTASVQWVSGNPAVATINGSGVLTGVSAGSSLTTANDLANGVSDTITVTVLPIACSETKSCTTKEAQYCSGESFSMAGDCGVLSCTGTRLCDYNWREVSP